MMDVFDADGLHEIVASYGYVAVFVVVMLESAGLPLPGETMLVSAAIYAGKTGNLSIAGVIAAAGAGAILGDNIGFLVGRQFGIPILRRYGGRVGLDRDKLRLAQYLFLKHGGKIVFFGRFVAVLRTFAALLAGANRYPFARFFLYNAAGGVVWATLFGSAAYGLGGSIHKVAGPFGAVMAAFAVVGTILGWRLFKRQEARLQAEADLALPDP